MLYDTEELRSVKLEATDGDIGSIDDVYFSDDNWTIRYLVVDTGRWLPGQKVLISPHAVQRLDADKGTLHLDLTRERVKSSPAFDHAKPVSRQYEIDYAQYYNYPGYWSGPYVWGLAEFPVPPAAPMGAQGAPGAVGAPQDTQQRGGGGDPNLRSAHEVKGYTIEASDGNVGHIETFLFDDRSWSIGAVVVDTVNWWPGKHVVVSPRWFERIDWSERKAVVRVTRERIKSQSEYDPKAHLTNYRSREDVIAHALHFGD